MTDPSPPSDDEVRREFLWMWDPFHSIPRAGLFLCLAAVIQAHGVLSDPEDAFWTAMPPILLVGLGGLSAWCRSVVRRDPPDRMRVRCERHAIGNTRLLPVMWGLAGLFLGLWGVVLWFEWSLWRAGLSPTRFGNHGFLMPGLGAILLGTALWYQLLAIPRSRRFVARLRRSSAPEAASPPPG